MDTTTAREKILKRISNSLAQKNKIPFSPEECIGPFFVSNQDPLVSRFTNAFMEVEGRLLICVDSGDLLTKLRALIEQKKFLNVACQSTSLLKSFELDKIAVVNKDREAEPDASITDCDSLVARTGAVVLSTGQPSGRVLPVYSAVHIVIAYESQLVSDIGTAIDHMKSKYFGRLPSAVFFAAGPSRTGDIERTLVVGVHGPREVYVFLMSDSPARPGAHQRFEPV